MKNTNNHLEIFSFPSIMTRLRNEVSHGKITEKDNLIEVEWLIKYLLVSKEVFKTVSEIDIFLSNMTGLSHKTKSTGRDRVVDWYLKEMKNIDIKKQNIILYRIIKYVFISLPTNYSEWNKILHKRSK